MYDRHLCSQIELCKHVGLESCVTIDTRLVSQYTRPSQVYELSSVTLQMYFISGFCWGLGLCLVDLMLFC